MPRSPFLSAAMPRPPAGRADISPVFAQGALEEAPGLTDFPYPHQCVSHLFERSTLLAVRDELTALEKTFKETDLFKVFQTGDLANLDPKDERHAAQLPNTIRLRAALYSHEFRRWVSRVTGCTELTEQPDLSCNTYGHGGHLLCHDDVIGTRAVSFILYLSWPDEGWTPAHGGGLELYELDDTDSSSIASHISSKPPPQPCTSPSLILPPHFGSLALFPVQPGRSFHAVAEVLSRKEPRVSISGWFHAPQPPLGAEKSASLAQLKTVASANEVAYEILPQIEKPVMRPSLADGIDDSTSHGNSGALSRRDHGARGCSAPSVPRTLLEAASESCLRFLSYFLNPAYLKVDTLKMVRSQLRGQGVVQMAAFLRPEIVEPLLHAAAAADRSDGLGGGKPPNYEAGLRGSGWKVVGPPHLQRFLRYEPSGQDVKAGASSKKTEHTNSKKDIAAAAGDQLLGVASILRSPPFLWLLAQIAGCHPHEARVSIRRFRPGMDYTLAHAGQMLKAKALKRAPVLDASFVVVPPAKPGAERARRAAAAWDSGDVGGFECLVPRDDSSTAAEVYNVHDDTVDGVTSVHPITNALVLAFRPPATMRFVKYVSAVAEGSRWDVNVEYRLLMQAVAGKRGGEEEEERTKRSKVDGGELRKSALQKAVGARHESGNGMLNGGMHGSSHKAMVGHTKSSTSSPRKKNLQRQKAQRA